jgi:two-component system OmpR family sensor kinase
MTIKNKLYRAFGLILAIIIFIVSIFFYAVVNLDNTHTLQTQRYEQIRRVEHIREFNSAFAWIVLDITVDKDKKEIVEDRLGKTKKLFRELYSEKHATLYNAETQKEKENIKLIYKEFDMVYSLILDELTMLVTTKNDQKLIEFNAKFEKVNQKIQNLIEEELIFLQKRLQNTKKEKEEFISKIKLELFVLLFISISLSIIISKQLISQIREMLEKLNTGVLQLLTNDENTIKINIDKENELSEITNNINKYLEQKETTIKSREELFRNISHELKTPITKGKFLLEKLKVEQKSNELNNIDKVFYDIERLISELLEREKLNHVVLKKTSFKISTLILESLSKLSIDDEEKINIELIDDFTINGDFYYLTLCVKNLIDNAIKYADSYPIIIKTSQNKLEIKNNAKKLSQNFTYYLQPFTREPNQQSGHGLGLNIVNKIVKLHYFYLHYNYEKSYNNFSIDFIQNMEDRL